MIPHLPSMSSAHDWKLTYKIGQDDFVGVQSGGIAFLISSAYAASDLLQGEREIKGRLCVADEIDVVECTSSERIGVVSWISCGSFDFRKIGVEPIRVGNADVEIEADG